MLYKKFSRCIWLGFFGIFFGCFTFSSASFTQNIRISEVHPTEEYIEIENFSQENIDLTNWQYSELSGSKEKFYEIQNAPTEFSAGAFFVISLSRKINDSGDTVRIYNSEQEQIDEVIVPKKVSGKSWQIIGDQWQWGEPNVGAQNFVPLLSPTPIPPTPSPISPSPEKNFLPLLLSEILPNPTGSDTQNEWIEIFNPNEEPVDLKDWTLEDASGKKFIFSGSSLLNSQEYKIFSRPFTGITLNNTGEKIFLFNPLQEKISSLEFTTSAKENFSYTAQGWTQTPTPNTQNNISLPSSFSSSSSSGNTSRWLFEERFFVISSPRIKSPDVIITKISANSSADFVEVLCRKCDIDMEGIRLGIDGEAYRIPKNIFVESGEILRFQFSKKYISNTPLKPKKFSRGWIFFVPISGLTTTDESIYMGDEKGKILDALCYANQNGTFTEREKDDLGNLMYTGVWEEKFFGEHACIDVSVWGRNWILTRNASSYIDTNRKQDFFLSADQKKFSPSGKISLQIEKIFLKTGHTKIIVKNTGNTTLDISHLFLANKNKFLIFLSEKEKFLAPQNTVTIHLPHKKFSRQDAALSIRDIQNNIVESVCFNPTKYAERYANRYRHFSKWKGKCFSISLQNNKIITLERKNFKEISSVKNFVVREEDLGEQNVGVPLVGTLEKNKINQVNHKGLPLQKNKTHSLTITPHKSYLNISGEIFSRPKDIILSIPKAKIKKRIRLTSTGKFSTKIFQPFKKGRYTVKVSYKEEIKNKIKIQRTRIQEKFLLPEKIFSDEISHLSVSKVLPNPQGRDSGKEIIIIKNTSPKSGWIRNWTLDQGRKTMKKLPHIFMEPGEEIFLEKKYFSTLKNSSGFIAVQNSSHQTIEKIAWQKAREGEYFGINAPKFFAQKEKIKKTKTKKTKKSKKETEKKIFGPLEPQKEEKILIITDHKNNTLFLEDHSTHKKFSYQFPQKINVIASQFLVGGTVKAVIKGDKILSLRLHQEAQKKILPQIQKDYFWIQWGILLGGIFSLGGWGIRKQKKIDSYLPVL